VASPGRQRTFRLTALGDALGQWQFLRDRVRRGLGDHMPCLERITSPPLQKPTFERLKSCPRCVVEAHSWAFLACLLAPGFPGLCCSCERTYLGLFSLQGVGQRQLKLIQLLQSCFHLTLLAFMWSHNMHIQMLKTDLLFFLFFFFSPSLTRIRF